MRTGNLGLACCSWLRLVQLSLQDGAGPGAAIGEGLGERIRNGSLDSCVVHGCRLVQLL